MNNKRYNQIIDEAYKNYWSNAKHNNSDCLIKQEEGSLLVEMRFYYKQEFINKCKTDPEFSEKWGLKIEERELSLGERYEIRCKKENIRNDWEQFYSTFGGYKNEMDSLKKSLNGNNIPTKLITVTYKDEKTEIYE